MVTSYFGRWCPFFLIWSICLLISFSLLPSFVMKKMVATATVFIIY